MKAFALVTRFTLAALLSACTVLDGAAEESSVEVERARPAAGGGEPGTVSSATLDGPAATAMSNEPASRQNGAASACTGDEGQGEVVDAAHPLSATGSFAAAATLPWIHSFRAEVGSLLLDVSTSGDVRVQVFTQGADSRMLATQLVRASEAIPLRVPRGAYSVRVEALAPPLTFELAMEASPYKPLECEPASDPGAVTDLGELALAPVERAGYVGDLDPRDSHRFVLREAALVTLSLREVRGDVALRLYRDGEVINESDFLLSLSGSDAADDSDSVALPRGSYQLRSSSLSVAQRHHLYTWLASAAEYPVQDAVSDTGDVSDVQDLGTLGPSGFRVGGYVGALDSRDTYRIQLTQSARIVLEFSDATGDLQAQLFRDAAALDDDSSLFRVVGAARASDPLEPGTYLVRVSGLSVTQRHFLYTLLVGLAP